MKIQKTIGAGVMSLGLVVGLSSFAGAQSGSNSIDTTGSHSRNIVSHYTAHKVHIKNRNDLRVANSNYQDASSGHVYADDNTTVGHVETGSAANMNSTNASVAVDNSASSEAVMPSTSSSSSSNSGGSIDTTGSHSYNRVSTVDTTKVQVENDNDLSVVNCNDQTATSGDATVTDNTTVGSVTTGDATNTNSTTISFKVSN